MAAVSNVLILTSNTGGGHQSAAQALEDSLLRMAPNRVLVKVTQVLEEASMMTRRMADLYNYLLRHHQDLMRYYYWAINHLKPNESRFVFKSALGYGLHLFERFCPNVIVSVHPMTQHFFAYILKKLRLIDKIPIVTVVTDPCYGFWRGWACDDVQQYYVASDEAGQQLMDYGIAPERIEVFGMPIHSRFRPIATEERRILRQNLGLSPDTFTLFVNAGWVGGGNIPKIYEALTQSNLPIQVVFLAGRNERLIQDGHHLAQAAPFPVHVVGYTEEIHRVMNAADVMVSKLGGLTTFEAMASQLPIIADIVTPPMPQEEQTATFIQKTGAGLLLSQPEQIVSVVQSLISTPSQLYAMRDAALLHGKPGAVDRIAEQVLGHALRREALV